MGGADKMVATCDGGRPCNALHAAIRMTINLPGHPTSGTQHYFNHEYLYNFIWVVVYSFALFPSN